jgi:hypothetical protein
MATRILTRTPWWFWAVAVVSLIWNSGGPIDWVMTKTHNAAYLAAVTPEQRAWIAAYPPWMEVAWAAGVWGAILGSVLLLARTRFAVAVFAVSLAGLVVGTLYQYGISAMPASLKTSGGMVFTAALWVGAILLLWFAVRMRARGVLR